MLQNNRISGLLGINLPLVLAPMAGPGTAELAIAVSTAGGLGSLPCAMLTVDEIRVQSQIICQQTDKPFNLNFFCHKPPQIDASRENAWKSRLRSYYLEMGLDPDAEVSAASRAPFSEVHCELVEELRPPVVSFHFGLPREDLLKRVKDAGSKVLASATTVAEARWLEAHGADVVIAQGVEAGGHRGMFLSDDIASQPGLFALLPQVRDAVTVPVIAAGGIADARGIAAAFILGADAVQMGTAYLFCPEAKVSQAHREALISGRDDGTALTNVFTGRPARGFINRAMRELGPMTTDAPAFPLAATALTPLRAKAEKAGDGDFSPLWAGQAANLAPRNVSAHELTVHLFDEAKAILHYSD